MSTSLRNARLRARRTAVASAGVLLLSAGSLFGMAPAEALDPGCVQDASTVTCTFDYTGATQTWTVPAGVTSATFDLHGAQGGTGTSSDPDVEGPPGGKGAHVTTTLMVSAGALYRIEVGGQPPTTSPVGLPPGYNGGGRGGDEGAKGDFRLGGDGGGATDLRTAGGAATDRVVVAGGGGGGGSTEPTSFLAFSGGAGGDSGAPGVAGMFGLPNASGGDGGGAGTQTVGGSAAAQFGNATAGVLGAGGDGSDGAKDLWELNAGGGGGGGYFGGGGGGIGAVTEQSLLIGKSGGPGGGGGGSSFVTPSATSSTVVDGQREGNGRAFITYTVPGSGDTTIPSATVTPPGSPTSSSQVVFDVAFSEPVTGFASDDIELTGTAGATSAVVAGSGSTYTVTVSGMTASGTVNVKVEAGAATDGTNASTASETASVDYLVPDTTKPTVTITKATGQADPTSASPIVFDVVFSEPVTGFGDSDVELSGSAGATTVDVAGSGAAYSVSVSGMTSSGTVVAEVPAGAATDGTNTNTESGTASVTYDKPPSVFDPGPTAAINGVPQVGATLTAGEGNPSPTPTSYEYQWYADDVVISDATGKTFTLTSDMVGKQITVRVTAKKSGLDDASDLSDPTAMVAHVQCGGKNATIVGSPGHDVLTGTDGVDVIAGMGGNDKITGNSGNDVVCGGDGTDTLDGGSGSDTLAGGDGTDTLDGRSNNDTLDGGNGADKLSGGSGKDNLTGGAGSPDICDGGSSTDSGGTGCETKKSIP